MKFALLVFAVGMAMPTSAVFRTDSASDDSSVTEAPCPRTSCPLRFEPVCATSDHRNFYYSFTNMCFYQKCLCTLNYPLPLVHLTRCYFGASSMRNRCPARGKLRQLEPDDALDLSYSPPQGQDNLPYTTRGYPASWEQSGEVFD